MLVSDSQNLTNQVKFPFLLSRNSLFLCVILLVLLLLGRTCNYNLAKIKKKKTYDIFHLYMLRTPAFLLDQFRATFGELVQRCFILVKRQIRQTTAFTFQVFPNSHFWQLNTVLLSCITFET